MISDKSNSITLNKLFKELKVIKNNIHNYKLKNEICNEVIFLSCVTRNPPFIVKDLDNYIKGLDKETKELIFIINNVPLIEENKIKETIIKIKKINSFIPLYMHEQIVILKSIFNIKLPKNIKLFPLSGTFHSFNDLPLSYLKYRLEIQYNYLFQKKPRFYFVDSFTGSIDPLFIIKHNFDHIKSKIVVDNKTYFRFMKILKNQNQINVFINLSIFPIYLRKLLSHQVNINVKRLFLFNFCRYTIIRIISFLKIAPLSDFYHCLMNFDRVNKNKLNLYEINEFKEKFIKESNIFLTWWSPANTPPSLPQDFPLNRNFNEKKISLLQHNLSEITIKEISNSSFSFINPIEFNFEDIPSSEKHIHISVPTSNILISSYFKIPSLLIMLFDKGFNPKWTMSIPAGIKKIGFNKIFTFKKNSKEFGVFFVNERDLRSFLIKLLT